MERSSPLAPPRLRNTALAYLVSAACLLWLFHGIHWSRLRADLSVASWRWVAVAVALQSASYVLQGWRWRLLLQPKGPISTGKTTQAIYAGLFANGILPLRVGELLRGFLVARWLKSDFAAVLPSIVVERLLDGIWLAVSVSLAAIFAEQLPPRVLHAGDILGTTMLAATVVFVVIVFWKGTQAPARRREVRRRWLDGLTRFVATLGTGLREIGRSRSLYLSGAISFLFLFCQVLAFWAAMWSYGLWLPFWASATVFLILHVGTTVPNAPANIGTFQFFTVLGLEMFGVEKTLAAGFSLLVFVLLTAPLLVIGAVAAARTGMTFRDLYSELGRLGRRP